MKNTDLRAKARAIFGSAIAEPMPKQPNGAKALQQRANARPIPTYKVGGPVKKPMPTPGDLAAAKAQNEMLKKEKVSKEDAARFATGNRNSRLTGEEMKKMKMAKGGKAGKYADGGEAEELLVEGRRPQTVNFDMNRIQGTTGGRMGPPAPSSGGGGRGAPVIVEAPAPAVRGRMPIARTSGYTGPTVDIGDGRVTAGIGRGRSVGVGYSQPFKKGGKVQKMKMAVGGKVPTPNEMSVPIMSARDMYKLKAQELAMKRAPERPMPAVPKVTPPDTNPKINFRPGARVAKGSFVDPFRPELGDSRTPPKISPGMKKGGKVQTSSDTARKLATEMGGFKKGGKVKDIEVDMKGLGEMSRSMSSLPKADLESRAAEARSMNTARAKETSDAAKKQSFKEAFNEARKEQGPNGVFTWRGNAYNTKMAGESSKAAPARAATPPAAPRATPTPAPTPTPTPPAATANKSSNAGSSMSSVARNLDTRSSIDAGALEARAKKIMAESGGSLFSSPKNKQQALEIARAEDEDRRNMSRYRGEQERKKKSLDAGRKANPNLVDRFVDMTMNPGYKKGGKVKEAKPKNGLAVMIAIGSPKKPAKKMSGGAPDGYAAGGAGKMRKGMMPEKFAQGGAGKVRKGMMSPEGNIINAMNKMRGK